jgi:hypothetical protein
MHFHTDFHLGKIHEILNNPFFSDSIKMFASLSTCDNSGILNYSETLRKNEKIDEKCLIKILIFTAAIYLVSKKRNSCVEILNKLGVPALEKIQGWQQSFFYSTWQLLFLQLKNAPNVYEPTAVLNNKNKKIIIGDSHIFGMVPGIINDLSYNFNYIPGLRYSLISSPQDNLKKVAIRNSLAASYEIDQVIFSIGEIDTRSFLIDLFNNNEYSIKNSINYFINIYTDSIEYIKKYLSHNQELIIIIPPPPFKIIKNFEDKNILTEIHARHKQIIDELKNILLINNVKFFDYPSVIIADDGYVNDDFLIDHAHFHQDIYMNLLGFKRLLS